MEQKLNLIVEMLSKIDNLQLESKKSATQSEEIKELVGALSKAQGSMSPAVFNRVNPHFKNRYADFTSCMECCRAPLANNGLSVMQYCESLNERLVLVTMLAHTSGQWMKSYFPLNPMKMDSQSIGSAMTYAKRYSLSAMLGIVSDNEDDDAEAAQGRGSFQQSAPKQQIPQNTPIVKMSQTQVSTLQKIESQLDDECKMKLSTWLTKQYKTTNFENLPEECFQKVFVAYENALKFLDQQKVEVVNA